MYRRATFTALILLIAILLPASAMAAQITMNFSGEGVKIRHYGVKENGWSGEFTNVKLADDAGNPIDNGGAAYCVQIEQGMPGGQYGTYTYPVDLVSVSSLGDNYVSAAWLMDNYAVGLGNDPLGGVGSISYVSRTTARAALGVAIWEVINDSVYDLEHGNFQLIGSGTIRKLANEYLAALGKADLGAFNSGSFYVAQNPEYQDVLVNVPTAGTPEPGTMLLLGSALAMGGYFNRRFRRA